LHGVRKLLLLRLNERETSDAVRKGEKDEKKSEFRRCAVVGKVGGYGTREGYMVVQ
jgi:hypothetical protein